MAELGRCDLFYLLVYVLKRVDLDRDWLFDRCREVQENPNGYLDLWAREHYKSTVISFGLTIQDILNDPELTIGIFSLTRPMAKRLLRQIKQEFELNPLLPLLYPDVTWPDPSKQSPKWSEDDGLTFKRKSNPSESTLEAWGLVDAMPTGKHFKIRIYDDVIDERNVSSPEMIQKAISSWELSLNLGSTQPVKRYTDINIERYIGTRYHYNDPYATIMKRGVAKSRIYPATEDGTPEGTPVLWTPEFLAQKRKSMGPFIFSCLPADAPILMADWSFRGIGEVNVGDEVIGIVKGDFGASKRKGLAKSRVLAKRESVRDIQKVTLSNGDVVYCTPDHKWWSGRWRANSDHGQRNDYAPVGMEYHDLKHLVKICDVPRNSMTTEEMRHASWLGGIFDGEGSTSAGYILITQSRKHNPEVCDRIEESLDALHFPYTVYKSERPYRDGKFKEASMYGIRGGRNECVRFLEWCQPAKRQRIADRLLTRGCKLIGNNYHNRPEVVSVEPAGEATVYDIQTETGNFVAYGYASSNCQLLLDPVADEAEGFKKPWLKHYRSSVDMCRGMNLYMLCDPAGEKKRDHSYTVILVIGLGKDRNYYLIDGIRDRINLTERARKIFEFHKMYRPLAVGYEKYSMQADIEHIESRMDEENYRFNIVPLGGITSKTDRIKKLIPLFEQGRFWLPQRLLFVDSQGKQRDLVEEFINDEYLAFPVGYKDSLDCMARIVDPELRASFPLGETEDESAVLARRRRAMQYDPFSSLKGDTSCLLDLPPLR